MSALLNIAIRAAREAGDYLLHKSRDLERIQVEYKGPNDLVSEIDRQTEERIITILRGAYPDFAILGEESGALGEHECQWIIDPLDGTTNYLHGFPFYCVSIALRKQNRITHGVIYDPERNELFTAVRGSGARLNDRRIRVAQKRGLEGCLLATGFPFRELDHLEEYIETFRVLVRRSGGIRRAGSAALDLAYVASGRFDGFWEFGLKPWDIAAGVLLIEEAGGLVGDSGGGHNYMTSGNVVAGSAGPFKEIVKILSQCLATDFSH